MKRRNLIIAMLMAGTNALMAQSYMTQHTATTDSLLSPTNVHVTLPAKPGLSNNALDALSGQSAGVNVSTNGADRMAMLNSVRVRGTTSIMGGNDPLVIIDGVTANVQQLSTIYPGDIESFSILKNASETALYGSRGASGVIVVTTKKGTGQGFQISYDGNVGVQSVSKKLRMLNAAEYVAAANALGVYCNNGGYDTDFQDVILRTGFVQNHHLAFSGGSATSNYRASFGYIDRNTVIKDKDYQNLVAKLDVSQSAFAGRLKGEFGVFGSMFKNHDINDVQGLFYSAAAQNPTFGPDQLKKNAEASQINPPAYMLKKLNDSKDLNFNSHLKLSFDILSDLRLSAFGSYAYSSTENSEFCPTWVWAQGNVYRGEFKGENFLGNIALNYGHTWGEHHLDAGVNGEYQHQVHTGFWTQAKGLTTNEFGYDNIGAASTRPFGGTGSSYDGSSLASVMGNISYTLLNRYIISATARGDGSSMVGSNHTWGFFPSVSTSWNIGDEAFMRDVWLVSMLKLHAGYGASGNLGGIAAYTTLNTVKQNGIVPVNGTPTVTLGSIRNTNPDLKWETRRTFNVGADLGVLGNRIVITAEYYYSKTTDMLYNYDVPVPMFAFDKLMANIGSMSNSGFEVGVSVNPIKRRDIELNVNMNLSFQKNKLLSLSGEYRGMNMSAADITPIGGLNGAGQHGGYNNVLYQIVGQPLGVFYLPHCTELEKDAEGNYKYAIEDLNHDGDIELDDGGDRYVAGQATPKVTLGSNISFRYKDFDISLQINGAFGHKIFNGTSLSYHNMSSFPDYNVLKGAPEKRIVDQNVTDYWLERGDYVNFEALTVGWNIPLRSTRVIRSLRVSGSVNNLATITGYSGLTPMINSYVVSSTLGIDDKRTYPVYRTFSMGLSIQF